MLNQDELSSLNRLHKDFLKKEKAVSDKIKSEQENADRRIEPFLKAMSLSKAKENIFRRSLKFPVKLDTKSNVFFIGTDENGNQIFHIEVIKQESAIVEVHAPTEQDAISTVKEMEKSENISFTSSSTSFINVSK